MMEGLLFNRAARESLPDKRVLERRPGGSWEWSMQTLKRRAFQRREQQVQRPWSQNVRVSGSAPVRAEGSLIPDA